MLFMDHHIQKVEEEWWKRLGSMLGTYWDEDSLEALFAHESEQWLEQLEKEEGLSSWVKKKPRPKDMVIPLSLIIQPTFSDALKKSYTSKHGILPPDWARDAVRSGDISEIFEWKPENFVHFISSVVAPVQPR